MRLIDADAVKEALRNRISENIDECINNVPTVCDIEDIKADIEAARYGLINDGLDVALRIIDKHTEGR